jgi:hypothetical protein
MTRTPRRHAENASTPSPFRSLASMPRHHQAWAPGVRGHWILMARRVSIQKNEFQGVAIKQLLDINIDNLTNDLLWFRCICESGPRKVPQPSGDRLFSIRRFHSRTRDSATPDDEGPNFGPMIRMKDDAHLLNYPTPRGKRLPPDSQCNFILRSETAH